MFSRTTIAIKSISMKNLKVVKEDGFFKKGDLLSYNEELDAYTLDVYCGDKFRSAMIDTNTAEELVEKEIMVEVDSTSDTVKDTIEFLEEKIKEYKQNLKENQEKFEKGELQPCIKVESETVLYNLIKFADNVKARLENE